MFLRLKVMVGLSIFAQWWHIILGLLNREATWCLEMDG